jgi:ABC-type glycerol-3-phosphate transport system substrate-binding protein
MNIFRSARLLAMGAALTASLGVAALASAAPPAGAGGGHTPITICHWVPAHGGSFIVITVDDDGANGNNNLQAHMGHVNDIIPANDDGTCGGVPD